MLVFQSCEGNAFVPLIDRIRSDGRVALRGAVLKMVFDGYFGRNIFLVVWQIITALTIRKERFQIKWTDRVGSDVSIAVGSMSQHEHFVGHTSVHHCDPLSLFRTAAAQPWEPFAETDEKGMEAVRRSESR